MSTSGPSCATPRAALVEAWAPSGIGEIAATGMAATVYLDSEERLVGWSLPDENVGVREDYR